MVVETTNVSNLLQAVGSGRNIRRLVERFTRVSPDVIQYEFTMDDPVRRVSPWTAAISLRRTDDLVYEVACHEGNYALPNILAGARAVDGTSDASPAQPGKICWDCEPPK